MPNVDTPLVMIWRQVPDLTSAKTFAESMFTVKPMGQDDESLMYDAGTMILGLWGQAEFARVQATNVVTLAAADPVAKHNIARFEAAAQCSGLNFSKVNLVVNPAVNLAFATEDLHMPRARLREEGFDTRTATSKNQLGDTLPFYDEGGNLFSMTHFSDQAKTSATGFVGPKLASMLGARDLDQHVVAGLHLMASDISKSEAFYTDVVGLQRLHGLDDTASFDAGPSILHLVPETTPRLVSSLRKSGRLHGDWLVFHTSNIDDKVNRFSRLGAKFPQGIEDSAIGRMAYFNDPDGYALVLWQPPADESLPMKKINFFPVLNRILRSANAPAPAPAPAP
jgi:predicted enzyme related to lactoylglutathione lyase